ncbi:unnamed protein product [Ranitomeya imitator]|uniref:Cytochrome P450 n=1 Tax=Ranitomeya imitator TaxID=111125 RepID=A0ABN9L4P1_9NEOB|nr:unnamed protein product [Ranitomeya imitator]
MLNHKVKHMGQARLLLTKCEPSFMDESSPKYPFFTYGFMCFVLEIEKVQSEIDKVIGSNEPQVIHRKEMPYTDAVIHEIQRFGNILPANMSHATTQDVNFRGYLLPKNRKDMRTLCPVKLTEDHSYLTEQKQRVVMQSA